MSRMNFQVAGVFALERGSFTRPLLILAATIVSGCATPSHPGDQFTFAAGGFVQAGREFDLSFGQEVQVQGTAITIRLVGVTDESRCPSDVQCVWAGNAVVKLMLNGAGTTESEISLNTNLDPRMTTLDGYSIKLATVKPYPRSGTTIKPADYVATLEVRRIQAG